MRSLCPFQGRVLGTSCVYTGFSSPSLEVWGVNCPYLLLFQSNPDSAVWKHKFQPFHCSAFPWQIFPGRCGCRTEPGRKRCGFLWKTVECTWNFRAVTGKTEKGKTLNLNKLFHLKGQILRNCPNPSAPCPAPVQCPVHVLGCFSRLLEGSWWGSCLWLQTAVLAVPLTCLQVERIIIPVPLLFRLKCVGSVAQSLWAQCSWQSSVCTKL